MYICIRRLSNNLKLGIMKKIMLTTFISLFCFSLLSMGGKISDCKTHGDRLPHETDPNKFYFCTDIGNGYFQLILMQCPAGQVFNNAVKDCDFPSKVLK